MHIKYLENSLQEKKESLFNLKVRKQQLIEKYKEKHTNVDWNLKEHIENNSPDSIINKHIVALRTYAEFIRDLKTI
jgi:hypothetical protein